MLKTGRSAFRVLRHLGMWLTGVMRLIALSFSRETDMTLYLVPGVRPLSYTKDLFLFSIAKALGVKRIVLHVRSGDYGRVEGYYFVSLYRSLVDSIIVLSNGLRGKLGVLRAKTTVVYNFTDVEWSGPRKSNLSGGRRVLYLANLIESKGYRMLVHSAMLLRNDGFNVELNIFGDGTRKAKAELLDLIAKHQLESVVRFHGRVTGRDAVRDIIQRHDVICLPSTYKTEAQPRSIIEAMSLGIPAVVSDQGSLGEIVKHGETGFVIPVERLDSCALAATLRQFFESDCQALANASRQLYERRHSHEVIRTKLLEQL